jgi:hypothetical protein
MDWSRSRSRDARSTRMLLAFRAGVIDDGPPRPKCWRRRCRRAFGAARPQLKSSPMRHQRRLPDGRALRPRRMRAGVQCKQPMRQGPRVLAARLLQPPRRHGCRPSSLRQVRGHPRGVAQRRGAHRTEHQFANHAQVHVLAASALQGRTRRTAPVDRTNERAVHRVDDARCESRSTRPWATRW